MVVEIIEELAVLGPALLEPGAVVDAELRQRFFGGDRLDLTHVDKRTEGLPRTARRAIHVPVAMARRRSSGVTAVNGGLPRRTRKPTMTSAYALVMEWR